MSHRVSQYLAGLFSASRLKLTTTAQSIVAAVAASRLAISATSQSLQASVVGAGLRVHAILINVIKSAFSDSASAQESGFLLNQSYCDITYFADDYVGDKRVF